MFNLKVIERVKNRFNYISAKLRFNFYRSQ